MTVFTHAAAITMFGVHLFMGLSPGAMSKIRAQVKDQDQKLDVRQAYSDRRASPPKSRSGAHRPSKQGKTKSGVGKLDGIRGRPIPATRPSRHPIFGLRLQSDHLRPGQIVHGRAPARRARDWDLSPQVLGVPIVEVRQGRCEYSKEAFTQKGRQPAF